MSAVTEKKAEHQFLPPLLTNAHDNMLCHIPGEPLLHADFSPDLFWREHHFFDDIRFLRAAEVIEARLETKVPNSDTHYTTGNAELLLLAPVSQYSKH